MSEPVTKDTKADSQGLDELREIVERHAKRIAQEHGYYWRMKSPNSYSPNLRMLADDLLGEVQAYAQNLSDERVRGLEDQVCDLPKSLGIALPISQRVADMYGKTHASKGPIAQARYDGYKAAVRDVMDLLASLKPQGDNPNE